MSKIEALEKRIAELEAEVLRLKATPPQVFHNHYHYAQPTWVPQPCLPAWPQYPYITYGAAGNAAGPA